MVADDETLDRTERLRQALDERAAREPGTAEFDRAQEEVDRLAVEFVELTAEGRATGEPEDDLTGPARLPTERGQPR